MNYPDSDLHAARNWRLTLLVAAVVCVLLCVFAETYRRAQGQTPSVRDDLDLWALERARVDAAGDQAIAILGTSRVLYGVDPDELAHALPGTVPVMLAVNGAYPLAALADLARDPHFVGTAFVDIDARGLARYYRDMQAPQVKHFNQGFANLGTGPSAAIQRRILSQWQAHMVIADAELGLIASLTRKIFTTPPPQPRHATLAPNRAGFLDFKTPGINITAMADNFAAGVRSDYLDHPPPPVSQWLADLLDVGRDVAAILARGGKVVFFCSPTSGAHLAADELGYPRAIYWDRFAREIAVANGAKAFYAMDLPAFAALALPDSSHIDRRDRTAFTKAVAALLR
jgi:hypothetical protein